MDSYEVYDDDMVEIHNFILTYHAGAAAEEVFTRHPVDVMDYEDGEMIFEFYIHPGYCWDTTDAFEKDHDEAINILKNNWPAVEALATALFEDKEVSNKKACEVVKNTPPTTSSQYSKKSTRSH